MRCIVILSGGIDSTTVLARSVGELGNAKVEAVSIDYGQRHIKEAGQARLICEYFNVKHTMLQLGPQPKSMLTDPTSEVPNTSYADLPHGVSPTYVPFRNGQLISAAAAYAQAYSKANGDEDVVIRCGTHAEDAQNWAYPDCTPEFIGAMANAILVGTYYKVRLEAPLTYMVKEEIIQMGEVWGAPLELTWSCYKGEELHCGTCPTCRARHDGFTKAGLTDPTAYANPIVYDNTPSRLWPSHITMGAVFISSPVDDEEIPF